MARPTKQWFKAMDKFLSKRKIPQVIEDIESTSGMSDEIKDFRESFIKFAALERMNYQPDIVDELKCYYERKRMYKWNVKKWSAMRKSVFERDNYTCQYCGEVGGLLEADHIVPFSKGGSNEIDNLTTSCRKCNRQKKDKSVKEFLKNK